VAGPSSRREGAFRAGLERKSPELARSARGPPLVLVWPGGVGEGGRRAVGGRLAVSRNAARLCEMPASQRRPRRAASAARLAGRPAAKLAGRLTAPRNQRPKCPTVSTPFCAPRQTPLNPPTTSDATMIPPGTHGSPRRIGAVKMWVAPSAAVIFPHGGGGALTILHRAAFRRLPHWPNHIIFVCVKVENDNPPNVVILQDAHCHLP
jgi:hypothetical protein